MEWNDVAAHVAGAGLAHIATADADGRPHAAKVAVVVDGEDLVFFTMRTSGKARNLAENPRIALMWDPLAEIYVWGDAELVSDVTDKTRIWESGRLPHDPVGFFGSPGNDDLVLVRIHPTRASVATADANGPRRDTWRR
jgi:general stress protein 26